MKETPYKLERLNQGNIHHVRLLFRIVFNKRLTVEQIKKKYDTEYTGMSAVGVIAFDENNMAIAFQGYIPCRFHYNGQMEIAVQSCDSLVVKEFRGKKLFNDIQQFGMEIAYAAGATFVYGFGNQNSTPIVVKQGWTAKDEMSRFLISSGGIPWAKAVNHLGLKNVYQSYVKFIFRNFKAKYTNQFSEYSSKDELRPVHDKEYIDYKNWTSAHFIMIGASPIWLKAEGHLHIGTLIVRTEDEMLIVVGKLRTLARKLGLREVLLQLKVNSREHQLFSKHFQGVKTWAVCYKNHNSQFPLENMTLNFSDIDTF